jgi:hypothetical protein
VERDRCFRCCGCIPPQFLGVAPCSYLDLSYNGFAGAVPASLSSFTGLYSLSLASNSLTSVSAEVLWLTARAVDVSANLLTGELPIPSASATPVVSSLNVAANYFFGPLPFGTVGSVAYKTATYIFDWNCFDPPDYRFAGFCRSEYDNCGNLTAQYPPATCVNHNNR